MPSLAEIDRDLDQIPVDASRLAAVQQGVAARGGLALAAADAELAALSSGMPPLGRTEQPRVDTEQPRADTEPPPALEDDGPPSGQIDVPDDVLASAELPAVLAISPPEEPVVPLSLDPDSGETPLQAEPAEPAGSVNVLPVETPLPPALDPPTETRSLSSTGLDDPNADLASLLGDSDPMREEGAAPLAPTEIEPEPTTMFTAEDAARFSRPAPPMSEDELSEPSDVELDLDEEMIELEDDASAELAPARPRTAPPPPPRTGPPPPPSRPSEAPQGRGFLGKLLQRKPGS